jgi:hypothetical protein
MRLSSLSHAKMDGMDAREKVSFTLPERLKDKLEDLKTDLRRRGLARSVATESGIIEVLIELASEDTLYRALRKR